MLQRRVCPVILKGSQMLRLCSALKFSHILNRKTFSIQDFLAPKDRQHNSAESKQSMSLTKNLEATANCSNTDFKLAQNKSKNFCFCYCMAFFIELAFTTQF